MKIELDANDVAAYLKAHPDFFNLYADLLAQIVITDPHHGRAVSITERQLTALRDRNKQLEAKLAELIQFGEENDAISEKLHTLSLALMRAETFTGVTRALHESLEEAFVVPHVALRLWDGVALNELPEQSLADEETRSFTHTLKRPYCGPSTGLAALAWLGSGIRSLALIPLRQEETAMGLLILGSEDIQRFYPEMGTLFLERIGDIVSAALLRTLEQPQ